MASTGLHFSEDEYKIVQHIINIPKEIELDRKCCIYRVPKNLREVKPEAYTPLLISVGPLHHHESLQQTLMKQRYFYFFWNRVSKKQLFVHFKSFLAEKEAEVRGCYSEKLANFTKEALVELILLDSIFIMELFLMETENHPYQEDDLFSKSVLKKAVQRDLLLLENQLPIFIFEELYNKLVYPLPRKQGHSCFLHLAHKYFSDFDPQEPSNEMMVPEHWKKSEHFTDLIRCFHIPKGFKPNSASAPLEVLKTATKLHDAGVIFHAVPKRCSLDIKVEEKFWHASFQIPQFKVHDTTECVFRNIMAFEQCHHHNLAVICCYISLLDNLINTDDDVDLLVDNEVIVHGLGSNEEVTTLINDLSKRVVINTNCYSQHIKQLNARHRKAWNHTIAKLWTVYFKDHWRGSSTIVGLAVLFLTLITFLRAILR